MQYLKHNWVRDGKFLTIKGQEGANMTHPPIEGLDVKHWFSSETEADYCLSTCPDDVVVTEVNPGLEILTKEEWDAIVATIPVPDFIPGSPQAGMVESPPDWKTFKESALASPGLNTFMSSILTSSPVAAAALPSSLLSIENGNYDDFESTWTIIKTTTTIPKSLITEFKTLADSCNLPQRFISIIS